MHTQNTPFVLNSKNDSYFWFSFSMKVKSGTDQHDGGETVEVTVYEYFTKHRNIELHSSAYMPCLDVGKPKRPNYLPLEVCELFPLISLPTSL